MMFKKKICLLVILASFLLAGCSSTELEERCFPMAVMVEMENGKVTYYASFKEEKTENVDRLNKIPDYNHLKVLVLEEDLLEQQNQYNAMLDKLAETEEFPRNTYVCVVDDVDDLFELEKNITEDLGSYLEEYLKKHEEKKDRLLTLGDLMDEKENQSMVLYLPYLEAEENFVEWKGYMNTSGKSWQESEVE